jgi:hypothetical protein
MSLLPHAFLNLQVRQPLELYVALSNKHRLAPQAAQGYLSVVPTKAHVEALENEPFVRKHLHSIKDEVRELPALCLPNK